MPDFLKDYSELWGKVAGVKDYLYNHAIKATKEFLSIPVVKYITDSTKKYYINPVKNTEYEIGKSLYIADHIVNDPVHNHITKPVESKLNKLAAPITKPVGHLADQIHEAENKYLLNPINHLEQKVFEPINKVLKEIHLAEDKITAPIAEGFKKGKNSITH